VNATFECKGFREYPFSAEGVEKGILNKRNGFTTSHKSPRLKFFDPVHKPPSH
jgi:hypothetical protein